MKNLSFQARCVTKPIKNALIGWWLEFYLFYIKHRDMKESQLYQSMVLDPGVSMTGSSYWRNATTLDAFGGYHWHSGTGMDWAYACQDAILQFFVDEGVVPPNMGIYPSATVSANSWLDSVMLATEQAAVDVNVDINADTVIKASEVDQAMRTYEMMVAGGLVNMSYEDWLRSYGVRQSQAVQNIPEIIRYVRTWTYPSSHINPADGSASSACSWSVAERADKDRFFAEPGFLFGVTVCRPKVYFKNMRHPAVALMSDAFSWLPAVLRDDAGASIKKVTDSVNDVIGGAASGDWYVDVKDLLLYGDQLTNIVSTATDINTVGLPGTNLEQRYVPAADVDAMFKTPGDYLTGVQMDGTVRLSILGTQTDTTPRGSLLG